MKASVIYIIITIISLSVISTVLYNTSNYLNQYDNNYYNNLLESEFNKIESFSENSLMTVQIINPIKYFPKSLIFEINQDLLNKLYDIEKQDVSIKDLIRDYVNNASKNEDSISGLDYISMAFMETYKYLYSDKMGKNLLNESIILSLLNDVYYKTLNLTRLYGEKEFSPGSNLSVESCYVSFTVSSLIGNIIGNIDADKGFLSLQANVNKTPYIQKMISSDLPRDYWFYQLLNSTVSVLPSNYFSCDKVLDSLYNYLLNVTEELLKSASMSNYTTTFTGIENLRMINEGIYFAKYSYPTDKEMAIEDLLYSLIRLLAIRDLSSLSTNSDYNQAINSLNVNADDLFHSYLNTVKYVRDAIAEVNNSNFLTNYFINWIVNYDILGDIKEEVEFLKDQVDILKSSIEQPNWNPYYAYGELKRIMSTSYLLVFGQVEMEAKHLNELIYLIDKGLNKS